MKIRTLIIDDEPIALEKLRLYVEKIPTLSLTAACTNAVEALSVLASDDVDLIITDINMPDMSGLELIKSLTSRRSLAVIFITAYPQYAVDSYKVSAVDYLLKPYGFAEFSKAVRKATDALAPRRHDDDTARRSLFVKVDYRYVRLELSDIRYIKGYGEYLRIYVSGRETPIVTLSSFAAMRERLTGDFIQVHRSYIVNMNHVSRIERGRIVMDADTDIPVGDSFKPAFQDYLATHFIGKADKPRQ